MRHIFRSTLLLSFTAFTLASCELVPDEIIDIFNPEPKPEESCELTTIHHPSDIDQGFTITIDSTGANQVNISRKYEYLGQELTEETVITPKPNDPNTRQADVEDEKGLSFKEVTVDAQKRLKRIYYSYDASIPEANLASTVTTYNYDKLNIVEATTLVIEGEDTVTFTTTFEYSLAGNLTKISSEDYVVRYEYGTTLNKLYGFQKAYAGFNVFSPISSVGSAAEIPLPSRNLPTKQIFETNQNYTVNFTWTINSKGYPTKLERLDENQDTRIYEYDYENCQ